MSVNPASLKKGDLVKAKLPFRDDPVLLCFEGSVPFTPGGYDRVVSVYVFKPVLSVELTFKFSPCQVRGFELV